MLIPERLQETQSTEDLNITQPHLTIAGGLDYEDRIDYDAVFTPLDPERPHTPNSPRALAEIQRVLSIRKPNDPAANVVVARALGECNGYLLRPLIIGKSRVNYNAVAVTGRVGLLTLDLLQPKDPLKKVFDEIYQERLRSDPPPLSDAAYARLALDAVASFRNGRFKASMSAAIKERRALAAPGQPVR